MQQSKLPSGCHWPLFYRKTDLLASALVIFEDKLGISVDATDAVRRLGPVHAWVEANGDEAYARIYVVKGGYQFTYHPETGLVEIATPQADRRRDDGTMRRLRQEVGLPMQPLNEHPGVQTAEDL